jgi:hypothetical protein
LPLQRTPHDIRGGGGDGKRIQGSREHPQEVLGVPAHVVTRGGSAKAAALKTRGALYYGANGMGGRVLRMSCDELLDVNAFVLVQADVFEPVKCR